MNTIDEPTPGTLVRSGEDGPIALVVKVDTDPGEPQIILSGAAGRSTASPAQLRPAGQLSGSEWDQVPLIAKRELAWLHQQLAAEADNARAQRNRADAAEATIERMRRYAIGAHRDRDICRDGLDRFLAAHDLPPYAPAYSAELVIRVQVTGHGENSVDIADAANDQLDVVCPDSDEVSVRGWQVERVEAIEIDHHA